MQASASIFKAYDIRGVVPPPSMLNLPKPWARLLEQLLSRPAKPLSRWAVTGA